MTKLMIVNVFQGVSLINLDQVAAISPLTTGGCTIHFNGDSTRTDGKRGHFTVTATDDFQTVVGRLSNHANVSFVP